MEFSETAQQLYMLIGHPKVMWTCFIIY